MSKDTNTTGDQTRKGRLIDRGLMTAKELGLEGVSLIVVRPTRATPKTPSSDTPQEPSVPASDQIESQGVTQVPDAVAEKKARLAAERKQLIKEILPDGRKLE